MIGIGKFIWAAFLEVGLICGCERRKHDKDAGEAVRQRVSRWVVFGGTLALYQQCHLWVPYLLCSPDDCGDDCTFLELAVARFSLLQLVICLL